jgi:hypothetical protein
MPDTSPGLASVISEAMRTQLVDVHTALPGRVESYDGSRQVADVKPMLRRVIRRENMERVSEELPVLPCVPVLWPRGGGAFISLPLQAGDFGFLLFAEYSLDRFRSTGDDVDPGDERRHDLANAVFLPCGPFPSSQTISDTSGSEVRIGIDEDYVIGISASEAKLPHDATEFLARADRVLSELNSIKTAFDAHTHAGSATAPTGPVSPTGTPIVPLPSPSDPKSDTVRGR